ncbi:pilus assembly protein PilM [Frateuria aurantia]
MGFFGPKTVPLLGVDISSSAVKVLQLAKDGNGFRVEHCAVEPLPPDAIVEKRIIDVDSVGDAVRKAVQRSGSKLKHAAAAVTDSEVIVRRLSMPVGLDEAEVEGQLQVEASQYIPYPLEEVSLDFQRLGPRPDKPELQDIMLVASRTENVDMRVAVLELGGLTAKVMDVESLSLRNAFSAFIFASKPRPRAAVIAVIDIGATMTTLTVLKDDRAIYSREQAFGGRWLTEEIARHYGLTFDEAGRAKRKGGLPEDYAEMLLDPFKSSMVQQASRLLQMFYAGSDVHQVDEVILVGGCAMIPGLAEQFREELNVPCAVADPTAVLGFGPRVSAANVRADGPALMLAVGLALRSFD